MQDFQADAAVELTVPATPEMMLVIRLTTSGFIARTSLTLDAADDFKFAVEESCGCLMNQCARFQRIALRFQMSPDAVTAEARGLGSTESRAAPAAALETEAARCVLESMADEVRLTADGLCVHTIFVSKRFAAS